MSPCCEPGSSIGPYPRGVLLPCAHTSHSHCWADAPSPPALRPSGPSSTSPPQLPPASRLCGSSDSARATLGWNCSRQRRAPSSPSSRARLTQGAADTPSQAELTRLRTWLSASSSCNPIPPSTVSTRFSAACSRLWELSVGFEGGRSGARHGRAELRSGLCVACPARGGSAGPCVSCWLGVLWSPGSGRTARS